MQPIMRWACENLKGFCRIMIADIFLFISFVGTVNGKSPAALSSHLLLIIYLFTVWRGIWALLDCYFLPGKIIEQSIIKCLRGETDFILYCNFPRQQVTKRLANSRCLAGSFNSPKLL